jgi:hypothetical protein
MEVTATYVRISDLIITYLKYSSPGHILFLAPSEDTTFKPPIPGNVNQDGVLKWVKENPSQIFFRPR